MIRCLTVLWCLTFIMLQSGAVCRGETQISAIETQVLQVFSTKKSAYYHKPWKSPDFSRVKGSGFFFTDEKNFPGQRGLILTNAHAVSMAQSIKVSNGREKRRYDVKMVGICDTADFAVLRMEPEALKTFEQRNGTVIPLELGDSDLLRVGDKVLGWGYPLGGDRISKSDEGEISRIEVNKYAYSGEYWLMVQASLQQNRGNSGGPVLKNGKVVGMAFQGMSATDRINYFIPINLVKHLMPLMKHQDQIPQWRYVVQEMFPGLKDCYHMGSDQGGVRLAYLIPGGGPDTFGLRVNDILTSLDGLQIDDFGEVSFKPLGQRIHFAEILNRKRVGDQLKATVIRDGKAVEITGTMGKGLPRLVPKVFTPANYFILDGVGFVELTMNCITNLGKAGETFREKYLHEYPKRAYEKIVIISEIFPEYGLVSTSSYLRRVEKINGEEVLNIKQLYEKIRSSIDKGDKWAMLELARSMQLPLNLQRAPVVDAAVKEKYGILYMKTPDGFRE